MKLCRFQVPEFDATRLSRATAAPTQLAARSGIVDGGTVIELTGDLLDPRARTGEIFAVEAVQFLPPSVPTKIVCVGRNYAEHAKELGNEAPKIPLIFLKPPSSVIAPEAPIVMPAISQRVDFEGELAVVIGRRCSKLRDDDAVSEYILGYTCLNDVTARDIQRADVQFTRGKGFDTFCPFGPVIETTIDPAGATVETYVNGVRKQSGHTRELMFGVDVILRFISRVMTLEPGDVIATGTPAGVGALAAGDVVEVVVGGVGTLRNPVIAENDVDDSANDGAN
jgi:2-keto-4-pentenoate hydratase/2-oxohepta-3-ene-1,7-dioic acid hydratase in catechol pathway